MIPVKISISHCEFDNTDTPDIEIDTFMPAIPQNGDLIQCFIPPYFDEDYSYSRILPEVKYSMYVFDKDNVFSHVFISTRYE
jgi:hypothetical protein